MSHEIRTPFQGLQGTLELLGKTRLDAEQSGYLGIAAGSASHLLTVLNDILDASSLETGAMKVVPAAVDLGELLSEVEALMRPQAVAKGLRLRVSALPGLPTQALLDPTRIRQVLFNLMANAIKFTEVGAVSLEAGLFQAEDRGPGVMVLRFEIADTGIGMDAATRSRLFERFAQGDNSRSRRFGGTGLGLEISRRLTRLMGGDIFVTSVQGQGSCFVVQVPWAEPREAASAGLQPNQPGAGTKDAMPLGTARRRLDILVAEDNEVNRLVIEAMLAELGHDAQFAVDGAEAVEKARLRAWDVVLMDLHMPKLDGLEATLAIRSSPDPQRSSVPVVALTADVFEDTRHRCAAVGISQFLTKPVSAADLQSCLDALVPVARRDSRPG